MLAFDKNVAMTGDERRVVMTHSHGERFYAQITLHIDALLFKGVSTNTTLPPQWFFLTRG